MKSLIIIISILLFISIFSCKPTEILLHGDIAGIVTDATSKLPLQDVSIKLNTPNDFATTGNDGAYLLKHLTPGEYEIQASSSGYAVSKQNVVLASAETKQIDFSLNGIPVPRLSVSFLDFGLDSVSLRFTISNNGKGNFTYVFRPSSDWITISPHTGDVSNDSVIIIVTINKAGLSESIYKENIKLTAYAGQAPLPDIIIPVYLNGVSDKDGNYYKVIRIGTQIWMAENLNVGFVINDKDQSNNGIIEKYCFGNSNANCNIYGGLYQWDEMMQYNVSDTGLVRTIQGICPVGWHIPTKIEWDTLFAYLGGIQVAGGKLKEAGVSHWLAPNLGATNESGFTALPGGVSPPDYQFDLLGIWGVWWSANEYPNTPGYSNDVELNNDLGLVTDNSQDRKLGLSVRCIKDPHKR